MNTIAKYETPQKNLIIAPDYWQVMKEQAALMLRSGFLPKTINSIEAALTIGIKGYEIGMPLMWSFTHIDIIQSKPTMKSEGQLGMIYKNCPTAEINILKSDDNECMIEARRSSKHKFNTFTFTMRDAQKMGLDKKDNWIKQQGVMLQWRCVSKMARAVFPDAIMGISYTPEEMGADVNEEGEVIVIEDTKKDDDKKNEPEPEIFDSKNIQHVSRLTKYLLSKGYTEADNIAIMKLMEGKASATIFDVLENYDLNQGEEK